MSKRRRSTGGRRVAEAKFWGAAHAPAGDTAEAGADGGDRSAPAAASIRPTPDPSVMVRSLGAPPLSVDHAVAERHLVAVYEEAVRAATALAAASGLLDTDEAHDT